MRLGRLLFSLLACYVAAPQLCLTANALQRERIQLNTGWTVRQLPDDGMAASQSAAPPNLEGGWLPAMVPGDVHLDLLKNGKIADPFYRDNEAKLQWIEKAGWEYRRSIEATKGTLARENVELVFDSLDTACTVFLNGQRVASPDSMFRQWRFDVKSRLHEGAN